MFFCLNPAMEGHVTVNESSDHHNNFHCLHYLLPSPHHSFDFLFYELTPSFYCLFSNPTGLLTFPSLSHFLFPQVSEWPTLSLLLTLCATVSNVMFSVRLPSTSLFYLTFPLDTPTPFNMIFVQWHYYYFYISFPPLLDYELNEAEILTVLFTDVPSEPSIIDAQLDIC